MPRDDLSIDFVKKMPSAEPQDPGLILDDWINRTANLPEEIRFMQEEIAEKDRLYHDCVKTIEEHDNRIQKWIKANGSHSNNPREENHRKVITENYKRADKYASEKILLTQKMQAIMDKHLRYLDAQIKVLYDRAEPGFTDPDELPSVLRPSAANNSNTSLRVLATTTNATPLNPILNNATPTAARLGNPQVRNTQSQQQHHNSASAPATPAASMILNRNVRESSAGPGSGAPGKRGPRTNSGLGSLPQTSSGLARHSSLGPGTPKGNGQANTVRAGSAGPRASVKTNGGVRKGTPASSRGLKKPPPGTKSTLSRVKRAGTSKGSPASTADSELSDAESGSEAGTGSEIGSPAVQRGTPAPSHSHGPPARHKHKDVDGDESMAGVDDDDEDGEGDSDDKKYCLCQNVSYGDMVACDNDDCPYEWFHWSCVGLKSEPEGRWFCPSCTENMKKKGK